MSLQSRKKIWIGPVLFSPSEQTLSYKRQVGQLDRRHCIVLSSLAASAVPGDRWEVVAREELLRALNRPNPKRGTSIEQIISGIRKAIKEIGADGILVIKAHSGIGYQILISPRHRQDTNPSDIPVPRVAMTSTNSEVDLAEPTDDALEFAATFNAGIFRTVGCCIERFGHFNLSSALPIDKIGWSPSNITISLDRQSFDASEILGDPKIIAAFKSSEEERQKRGLGTALIEPNGTKFAVVDVSSPFCDTTDITITMRPTTYFDILRARPGIADPNARIKYGHVIPSKNRIPQAAGIQFAVLFADERILTIKRAEDAFPWPGTWSFSGEEQIADVDMEWEKKERMKRTLLRTAVEEVLPLSRIGDRQKLLEVMDLVEPHLISIQTWSLFIEELTGILQIFSVFHLRLTAREYADVARKLVQEGKGKPSYEGLYYTMPLCCIEPLLRGEAVSLDPLFGHTQLECNPNELHPTSRYRLLSLRDYALHA